MSSEVKNVLFIVNNYAGRGFNPAVEGRIIEACKANNTECTIEYTNARGHATLLAKSAAENKHFQYVVAVGGDGTINEVAQGLLHSDIPMGIIPKGSGNGLARHLSIPVNVPKALKALFNSQVIRMDTFLLNDKLSLNVSGIGFDGHIANLFGTNKKRGFQTYTKLSINEFLSYKEFDVKIDIQGKTLSRKAFIIAIANSSQYGNNARIAPVASVCDNILHIAILKKVPMYRLDVLYSFFAGRVHESTFYEILEASHVTFSAEQPISYHIDGEPGGSSQDFVIRIQPASLSILIPASASSY